MTKEETVVLNILGFYFLANSLSGVFLNLYLFKLGGFHAIVSYGVISLIVLFIFFFISGKFLQSFSTQDLVKTGFVFFCIVFALLFVLKEQSIHYLYILSILNGIGLGTFWPGINLSSYIVSHEHTRNKYFGNMNFLMNLSQSIGPVISGLIIYSSGYLYTKNIGYTFVFFLVFCVMFYLFFYSSKLPCYSGIQFAVKHLVKHKRKASWNIVLTQQFLYGLFDVAFGAFSGVLIFFIVNNEFSLGVVNAVSTCIFAVSSLFAGRILQKHRHAFILGALFSSVGLLIFALQQNWLGIISLMVFNNMFIPYLNIPTSKAILDVIDKEQEPWQEKYHFLIERDSVLGLGRIINYIVLLLIFTQSNQIEIAKKWILLVPIFPLLIGILEWYQYKLSNKWVLK